MDSEEGELSKAAIIGIASAAITIFLLIIILVTLFIIKRVKQRRPKLVPAKVDKYGNRENDRIDEFERRKRNSKKGNPTKPEATNIAVLPPAPYIDPSPHVKVVRQPLQEGKPTLFVDESAPEEADMWGMHNVLHVEGSNDTHTPLESNHSYLPSTSPQEKKETEYMYRLFPTGERGNYAEYDYKPIKVESGVFTVNNTHTDISETPQYSVRPFGGQAENQPPTNSYGFMPDFAVGYSDRQQLITNDSGNDDDTGNIPILGNEHSTYGVPNDQPNYERLESLDADADAHSIIQDILTLPDGTTQHRVSLNLHSEKPPYIEQNEQHIDIHNEIDQTE